MQPSIIDRVNAGEFKSRIPHPVSKTDEELVRLDQAYQSALQKSKNAKEAYDVAYRRKYKEHQNASMEAIAQFRQAVEEEFGTTEHPKRDQIWRQAWDRGHAEGLAAVYHEYQELMEIVS